MATTILTILLILVFFSGAAIVFLKGSKQSRAIDIFLATGTIGLIVLVFTIRRSDAHDPIRPFVHQTITFNADCLQVNLGFASALQSLYEKYSPDKSPQAMAYAKACSYPTYDWSINQLKTMMKGAPNDEGLRLRWYLVRYAKGDNVCSDIQGAIAAIDQHDLLNALEPIFCKENRLSPEQKLTVLELVHQTLPPGWYRDVARLAAYSSFGDDATYQSELTKFRDGYANRAIAILVVNVIFLLLALTGLIVIYRFCRSPKIQGAEPLPSTLTLKSIAAIWLFAIYWRIGGAIAFHNVEKSPTIPSEIYAHNVFVMVFSELSLALGLGLAIYAVLIKSNQIKSYKDIFKLPGSCDDRQAIVLGFWAFCSMYALATIATIIASLLGIGGNARTEVTEIFQGLPIYFQPLATCLITLTIVLIGPMLEELVHRALIYTWLRKHCNVAAALLISSLIFAAMHRNPGQILPLMVIGIVLGIIFERSRNIWASITCHSLYNLTVTVYTLLFP